MLARWLMFIVGMSGVSLSVFALLGLSFGYALKASVLPLVLVLLLVSSILSIMLSHYYR